MNPHLLARGVRSGQRPRSGSVWGRILSIGSEAQGVLSALEKAHVVAVFENSLYLRSGAAWACLGHRTIGRGPLNITCEIVDAADWRDVAAVGEVPFADGAGFSLGLLELTTAGAAVWQPRLAPARDAGRLERGLEVLTASLPADLPGEGLAPFLCASLSADTAVSRAARQSIAALAGWLRTEGGRQGASVAPREAVRRLLGLGPGLTPSGDDFLAGLVVGLRATGRLEAAQALGRELAILAPLCTSHISAAHLMAALRAGLREDLQTLIHAVLQGDGPAIKTGLRHLDRTPHCSSWDALAGVTTAFRGVLGKPLASCPRSQ